MTDGINITAIEAAARERYRSDPRFHRIASAIVARVLQEHGEIDRERPERDVADIATRVAALVMEAFYQDDAELNAQRAIAEKMKALALETVALRPPSFIAPPNDHP